MVGKVCQGLSRHKPTCPIVACQCRANEIFIVRPETHSKRFFLRTISVAIRLLFKCKRQRERALFWLQKSMSIPKYPLFILISALLLPLLPTLSSIVLTFPLLSQISLPVTPTLRAITHRSFPSQPTASYSWVN